MSQPPRRMLGRFIPALHGSQVRARAAAPGAADPIAAHGHMLRQLAASGLADEVVLRAMGAVDRRLFVEPALARRAYEDTALSIGLEQTISKPSVVARMLTLLRGGQTDPATGKLSRVLDIGTGCGYQASVLAHMASEVYSIERLRGLHERVRHTIAPLRLPNLHLILGDGMAGFASGAPYAGIIAAAGGNSVPPAWVEQLAVGGRIVAPVDVQGRGRQSLVVIEKTPQGISHAVLEAVHFVPLKSGVS